MLSDVGIFSNSQRSPDICIINCCVDAGARLDHQQMFVVETHAICPIRWYIECELLQRKHLSAHEPTAVQVCFLKWT